MEFTISNTQIVAMQGKSRVGFAKFDIYFYNEITVVVLDWIQSLQKGKKIGTGLMDQLILYAKLMTTTSSPEIRIEFEALPQARPFYSKYAKLRNLSFEIIYEPDRIRFGSDVKYIYALNVSQNTYLNLEI